MENDKPDCKNTDWEQSRFSVELSWVEVAMGGGAIQNYHHAHHLDDVTRGHCQISSVVVNNHSFHIWPESLLTVLITLRSSYKSMLISRASEISLLKVLAIFDDTEELRILKPIKKRFPIGKGFH